MNTVTRSLSLLMLAFVFLVSAFAQAEPNQPFPDQFVAAGISFDQPSAPQLQGFVSYAKLASAAAGIYSYTKVSETSIKNLQTQTETGVCAYVTKLGVFDVFGCGTGGLATAGTSTGVSASGTFLLTKQLKKGWTIGFAGGPSYSGAAGKVSYPFGLIIGWGR